MVMHNSKNYTDVLSTVFTISIFAKDESTQPDISAKCKLEWVKNSKTQLFISTLVSILIKYITIFNKKTVHE